MPNDETMHDFAMRILHSGPVPSDSMQKDEYQKSVERLILSASILYGESMQAELKAAGPLIPNKRMSKRERDMAIYRNRICLLLSPIGSFLGSPLGGPDVALLLRSITAVDYGEIPELFDPNHASNKKPAKHYQKRQAIIGAELGARVDVRYGREANLEAAREKHAKALNISGEGLKKRLRRLQQREKGQK